ncbi:MAG: transcriptional repressor NrdR [Alphaproteobacteria bacterium]|jgi:transcriptional repressor NrdR
MKCPFCSNNDTQVKDSRPSEDGRVIRRRRACPNCDRRFTTFERFQIQQVFVVKSDGRRELFEPEKLTRCLLIALGKRPVTKATVSNIISEIEQTLSEEGKSEIMSKDIGDLVLEKLKNIDFVGYIRYASVYNDFDNLNDFYKLVGKLDK